MVTRFNQNKIFNICKDSSRIKVTWLLYNFYKNMQTTFLIKKIKVAYNLF